MEETKKELSAYLYNKELLKEKEQDLEELITKAEKVTTELSDMPKGTPIIQDKIGEYATKIVELKNSKYRQLIDMYKSKEEIENKIDMLEQPYRNILYYKYIKGMNLTEVANKIGNEYKYTCILHGEALNNYKKLNPHDKKG